MAEIGQRSEASISQYADATAKSARIWAAGVEPIFKPLGEMMRAQADENRKVWEAMCRSKSFNEACDIQAKHIRSSYHKAATEVSRINDGFSKLMTETIAPFTEQLADPMATSAK